MALTFALSFLAGMVLSRHLRVWSFAAVAVCSVIGIAVACLIAQAGGMTAILQSAGAGILLNLGYATGLFGGLLLPGASSFAIGRPTPARKR